jgi:hypothetical protein
LKKGASHVIPKKSRPDLYQEPNPLCDSNPSMADLRYVKFHQVHKHGEYESIDLWWCKNPGNSLAGECGRWNVFYPSSMGTTGSAPVGKVSWYEGTGTIHHSAIYLFRSPDIGCPYPNIRS